MTKRLAISSNDFGLFDGELNSYEYEYFCKHIGAFKRFMQEEPKEQRQLFLDAFCEYSYNHIEIKAVATMSDPKKKFIESFRQYAQEAFINGKFSAAKQFLNDSVIVTRSRHMIGYMDSHSYAKDPFFHKDTRDVFRRLFGEPTEAGTCVKVICVLPLYVRFAGSICRYLKKWLDMEESLYTVPVKTGKKTKAEKRAMREQAIAIARNVAIAQPTKPKSSQKIASSSQQRSAATGASKTGSAGGGASSKSITNGEQSNAVVPKAESKSCTQAELDAAEDFSSFYYDMHERKQRKRDLRKKGKKHEHLACQHPCHGKVCNCNPHKHSHSHCHHHDHHHDHGFEQPPGTREELMGCLCEKHKALAQATLAHKKAALDKRLQDEKEKPDDKNSEGGQSSEGKNPVGESSENKNVEEKGSQVESSEEKTSEVETSEEKITEDKKFEAENSGETNAEETYSENKLFEDINSGDQNFLSERSVSETSESLEALGDKICENNISEDKSSEDKSSENECKNLVCHDCNAGNSDIANGEESDAKVLLDKNKCYSQAELDAAERFIRKNYPELDMCSQHRNELSEKVEEKLKEDVTKETRELKNEIDSECKESKSSEEKCLESKSSEEKSSEGSKSLEDKSSGDQTAECKEPDKTKSSKDDKLSPRRKKSHKVIRENGLISSDESDYGNDEIEMVLRKDFPGLHLCEPHPNEIYRTITAVEEELKQIESVISGSKAEFEKEARVEMDATEAKLNGRMEDGEVFAINGTKEDGDDLSEPRDEEDDEFASEKSNDTRDDEDEGSGKEKSKEIKLRTCAFCRVQETEVKTFKKCQKCKGKRTKFYCGRDCQRMDWIKHRLEH